MTFSETITELVKLYSKGMRAKKYEQLRTMRLNEGICYASLHVLHKDIEKNRTFNKYKPKGSGRYWYSLPYDLKLSHYSFAHIKEKAIKPRLELLKRIKEDLNNESK